jgi:hypothetical protein
MAGLRFELEPYEPPPVEAFPEAEWLLMAYEEPGDRFPFARIYVQAEEGKTALDVVAERCAKLYADFGPQVRIHLGRLPSRAVS